MPTDRKVLGFSNKWYKEAVETAMSLNIGKDLTINLISPACFLATKLEAFKGRGKADYFASHDLEDIISLIDGRSSIMEEVKCLENKALLKYLRFEFSNLMQDPKFIESILGHLGAYTHGQGERHQIVCDRIQLIVQE